jgi:hypothetical protein
MYSEETLFSSWWAGSTSGSSWWSSLEYWWYVFLVWITRWWRCAVCYIVEVIWLNLLTSVIVVVGATKTEDLVVSWSCVSTTLSIAGCHLTLWHVLWWWWFQTYFCQVASPLLFVPLFGSSVVRSWNHSSETYAPTTMLFIDLRFTTIGEADICNSLNLSDQSGF